MPFASISSFEDAIEQKAYGEGVTEGIFFINTDYSRGYDIKLAEDAHVIILDDSTTMTLADVR